MNKETKVKKLMTLALTVAVAGTLVAGEVMVKGSDTMLNLVQTLAESFSSANPDITVSVAGGGSGVGINSITNGECDIANSSRAIKSKEISTARANGVNPVEYAIAIDGLCVITNPDNPIKQLTVEQLGRIYRGEVTNWSAVGGPKLAITLYGRQPNSGTFVYFRDEVGEGRVRAFDAPDERQRPDRRGREGRQGRPGLRGRRLRPQRRERRRNSRRTAPTTTRRSTRRRSKPAPTRWPGPCSSTRAARPRAMPAPSSSSRPARQDRSWSRKRASTR